MLILIDNFDSFTYNIVQAFQILGVDTKVIRNNALKADEVFQLRPDFLVIGPGPGNPSGAGISKACIELTEKCQIPVLGICLGHQTIGEVFGGKILRAKKVMHGKTSKIFHHGRDLFKGIPQGFIATRYHSLIVDLASCELELSAWTEEDEVMAIAHPTKPIYGVQFHPESVASEHGFTLLKNFLTLQKFSGH